MRRSAAFAPILLGLLLASPALAERTRKPAELYLALGYGDAVCGDERPDSACAIEGGTAVALGGGYRFHPHWLAGLELGAFAFAVRDQWRGQLENPATDVTFSSSYIAPFARWYWFGKGTADPYLMAGLGAGTVTGEARNDNATYVYTSRGLVYLLGIGVEWQVADIFRLGPQFLAYLHVGSEVCEDAPGTAEQCRAPGRDEHGDREGLALPYRLVLSGTFTLGK
jgi:hypothetical protein